MANELSVTYTGSNAVYAIIRRTSDSKVWSVAASDWATWVNANVDDYDTALTDRSGDLYSANFPTSISTGIEYRVNYYERAGAAPAITDLVLIFEEGIWNGTSVSSSYTPASTTDSGLSYSSLEDVELILPQKMVDRKNSSIPSITPALDDTEITDYISRADREIDAYLEQYYSVPLRRIKKRNPNAVDTSVVSTYPDPIPFCSARMAASYLINEKFTSDGSHADSSRFGERYLEQSMTALDKIANGIIMLPGQLYKGHRYLRPESRDTTTYPAEQRK